MRVILLRSKRVIRISKLLLLFILFPSAYSSTYCFSNKKVRDMAYSDISPFLLTQDRSQKFFDKPCLELMVAKERLLIVEKVLSRNYRWSRSLAKNGTRELNCFLKGSIKAIKNFKKTNLSLNQKSEIKEMSEHGSETQMLSLLLAVGKEGIIQYNKQQFSILCQKSAKGFQLTFGLKNNKQQVSSNVFLSEDQELEVGNILNNLSGKASSVGIPSGVEYQKKDGEIQTSFKISISTKGF